MKNIDMMILFAARLKAWVICCAACCFVACNKLIEIKQPVSTVTEAKTFASDVNANSVMAGIYSNMNEGGQYLRLAWANGLTTICTSLTGDELNNYSFILTEFQDNAMLSSNDVVSNLFWGQAYYNIYQANALMENLTASTGVSDSVKKELTAEAKFIRAFCLFNLVNLFGDIPLVTKSAWYEINTLKRSPIADVYAQIIQDLKDAQAGLLLDYSVGGGEKIRANYWAARALLARVYLYKGDWANAETEASAVISSGLYHLPSYDAVFLKNSDEAILQLQTLNDGGVFATQEGNSFVPPSNTESLTYSLTDSLLNAFEPGDLRRQMWVDSSYYNGAYYYYPAKYRVRVGAPGDIREYYMVLRLGEQYLIRAEARAHIGTNLSGAIEDVNTIRQRANLPPVDASSDQTQVITAIMQERRIELFAEWGHRWFDLKRTGQTDDVLKWKPGWTTHAKLWPIPAIELTTDPLLTQNPGY